VRAGSRGIQRRRLVRVEPGDASRDQGGPQGIRQRRGRVGVARRARRDRFDVDDLIAVAGCAAQ